jgi:hypothetical protein
MMKLLSFLAAALVATSAAGQTAPPPATKPLRLRPPPRPRPAAADAKPQDAATLKSLAWLEGCWLGTAGQREFREQWMPLRGAMMIGVSQTLDEKGRDARIRIPAARAAHRRRLLRRQPLGQGRSRAQVRRRDQRQDERAQRHDFHVRESETGVPAGHRLSKVERGWLYASVEGKVGGADRKATYPMRRINCETGEVVKQ